MGRNSNNIPVLRNSNTPIHKEKNQSMESVLSHYYINAATSKNTRKAYQADLRHFICWGGLLPSSTTSVSQYLQAYANQLNPRTLVRRLTALKQWHLEQGFTDPTSDLTIQKVLTGIKNIHGKPKKKAKPLSLETLMIINHYLTSSTRLIDCRNNALLQIGFFAAFRRSEIVAVQWEDINLSPEGIEIVIPRSKTDQTGEGQVCAITYGNKDICPIKTLIKWRDRSHGNSGYVFRQITKRQNISNTAIKPNQINIIIKAIIKACGLPESDLYSSHSLRRGFATEASKKGVPFGSIMRQGRWEHEGTVSGYIDEGKLFDKNAVDIMLNKQKNETKPTSTNSD